MKFRKSLKALTPVLVLSLAFVFTIGCSKDENNSNPAGPSTGPAAPALSSPADGADFGAETVAFDWSDVSGAVAYQLVVAANANFSPAVLNDTTLTASTANYDLSQATSDGAYFWRVRGKDSGGNWGDWSPVRTINRETVVILTGTITQNTTLVNEKRYLLRGGVFIGRWDEPANKTVLTIEPGTSIYGESASNGMLVISRGGKINAQGTAAAPIVFTSDKPVGQRARSDWGGVIINGWAPLNSGASAEGEGGTGTYGGDNPNDDSGIIKYVRIEFAGREISPDNELNGLALQGVGSATVIDYLQVHMNKDDGIEFFGGNASARHVYLTGSGDDNFDWTDGWQGRGQFWVCQQYGDDGDRGIEADNNAENLDATPRSMPTIYNLTLVGARDIAAAGVSTQGTLLREGTGAKIYNAIVMNWGDCGIDLDHEPTFTNSWNGTALNGTLVMNNSIFYSNTEDWQTSDADEAGFPFTTEQFIRTLNGNNRFANPSLNAPLNRTAPDFRPAASSIARTGAATPPNDGFFESVSYVGGMDPNSNWLTGWTTSASN